MSDTLELVDLAELVGEDIKIPCLECPEEAAEAATWTASHGRPGCMYYLCTKHKQSMQATFSTQRCDHKHCKCNFCGDEFSAKIVVFCPLEQ